MLKNTAIGIAIGLLVMGGIWGLVHLMNDAPPEPEVVVESVPGANKGVMDLICELDLDLDGQLVLGIKENEPTRITIMKAGSITNSPWAKLIVPEACHSKVKPKAASA